MDQLVTLTLVGVALLVGWWWWQQAGTAPGAETRLRRICLGDEMQASQLINAELDRAPGISREEAASRAVFRYERDNR